MSTYAGWPNGKNLRLLASKFELDQSYASRCKSAQVGGQTKRKSKTCVDLRVRLARAYSWLPFYWLYNQIRKFGKDAVSFLVFRTADTRANVVLCRTYCYMYFSFHLRKPLEFCIIKGIKLNGKRGFWELCIHVQQSLPHRSYKNETDLSRYKSENLRKLRTLSRFRVW